MWAVGGSGRTAIKICSSDFLQDPDFAARVLNPSSMCTFCSQDSTKLQRSHADATGKSGDSGIKVNKLVGERVIILLGLPNAHSLSIRWILLATSDCTALRAMAPGGPGRCETSHDLRFQLRP